MQHCFQFYLFLSINTPPHFLSKVKNGDFPSVVTVHSLPKILPANKIVMKSFLKIGIAIKLYIPRYSHE